MMLRLLFIFLFVSLPTTANWIDDTSPYLKYEIGGQTMPYAQGLYIYSEAGFTNPNHCKTNKYVVFTDPFLIDKVLSTLFFAHTSNKKLKFYIVDCKGSYIHGHAIQLIEH